MAVYLPNFTVEAEINNVTNFNETQKIYPKGISSSSFKRCWDAGFTGKDIIVAIIDTGIDSNHPDLKGKIIKAINLTGESISESHGTHVAGTIAANGWILGGAPDVSLIDIKVLGRRGGTISNVIKGIALAVASGASVINLSLGTNSLSNKDIQKLTQAINNAWRNGVLCIAAAGNDGTSICTPDPYSYPASVKKAESIAACDVGENLNTITLAYFSNENNRVDLTACGLNVLSTIIGGNYAIYSGTSMATPHVSAMAAILSQYIRYKYPTIKGSTFSAALSSLLHSNVLKVESCGIKANIMISGKTLLQHSMVDNCYHVDNDKLEDSGIVQSSYENISFGLGFIRYEPNNDPINPGGEKYYYNNIFLGHRV